MIRTLTIPLFLNTIHKIHNIKNIETNFSVTKKKMHTLDNTVEKHIIINLITHFI